MALTRQKKHQKVAVLASEMQTATAAIIGTFTAMTADKDMDLRKIVRGAGGKYHVLKNKLAPVTRSRWQRRFPPGSRTTRSSPSSSASSTARF